jgi:acyl-coenzyme A thioesterase PaaI-like protein
MTITQADLIDQGWSRLPDDEGFIGHIGPLWSRRDSAGSSFGFLAEPKHANLLGVVQGGMLMSLGDRALGLGAWEAAELPGVTIQYGMHFVSSAHIGEFVEVTPILVRRTRSLVFLNGTLEAGGRVVATATGIWRVLRESRAEPAAAPEARSLRPSAHAGAEDRPASTAAEARSASPARSSARSPRG